MGNIETVQQIYEAFARGDVAAILDKLDETVEWEYTNAMAEVPWLTNRHGRSEVPKFFESLGAVELHKFQPKTFLEDGRKVVALIDVDLTVKATGRRVSEEDEVHIWHFNPAGRVSKFAHKLDTHRHWLANGGGVAR